MSLTCRVKLTFRDLHRFILPSALADASGRSCADTRWMMNIAELHTRLE